MLVHRTSLVKMAATLRRSEADLLSSLDGLTKRLDSTEPSVAAWLPEPGRPERLARDAAALAERWPDPAARPPLYGVPVGIKDIFHLSGFVTHANSALPPELFAGIEGGAVSRLRQAGALFVGKTVTTEFAFAEPGPTRNPHHLEHTPGGSSSGSAAAVACGTCLVALGTQTVGSVIRPAAFCGVVGVKPSFDRIPTSGLVYFSRSADHVGYFAQDVAAARLAARVLYDAWHDDQEVALGRLPVLGVPVGPYLDQASPEALGMLRSQLKILERAGYEVREVAVMADLSAINRRHQRMIAAEAAAEHAEWFTRYETVYRPRTAAIIREGLAIGPAELTAARDGRFVLRGALEQAMTDHGIDLWACPPATGTAPRGIGSTGDPIMNLPWTHAGLPVITVPAGFSPEGLPYGLQLGAPYGQDEQLLAWAEGIAAALEV